MAAMVILQQRSLTACLSCTLLQHLVDISEFLQIKSKASEKIILKMCCSRKHPYPPHRMFLVSLPYPSGNMSLASYFPFYNCGFSNPPPPWNFSSSPCCRPGYFMELHNIPHLKLLFSCSKILLGYLKSIFKNYFTKAIEHFFCVYIASSKQEEDWENSRKLCKPLTTSQLCITVSNSPNPSRA